MSDRFFVVTGGPGSGKTTLIEALVRAGFAGSVEAGRRVIQDEVASGGTALPWIDPARFAERMLEHERRSYAEAGTRSGPVFFDRGLPDLVGYMTLSGLPVPASLDALCRSHRYASRVFVAPPWAGIYANDAERKQSFEEAVRTHDVMAATYPAYGYELVELPRAPVEVRVRFLLAQTA